MMKVPVEGKCNFEQITSLNVNLDAYLAFRESC